MYVSQFYAYLKSIRRVHLPLHGYESIPSPSLVLFVCVSDATWSCAAHIMPRSLPAGAGAAARTVNGILIIRIFTLFVLAAGDGGGVDVDV